MRPQGLIIKEPSKSEGYSCKNATFNKYGKEISIHDHIQAGKDGTIAAEIIKKANGIENIAKEMQKIPESNVVIDMNMDPYIANRILQAGKIEYQKLQELQKQKLEGNKVNE